MLTYEGRSSFDEFLAEVQKLVDKQPRVGIPKVNAYFMATDCGLKTFGRTKQKLEKFAEDHKLTEVTVVATKDMKFARRYNEEPQVGLKVPVTSSGDLKVKWLQVVDPKSKLTASCGCSIFISDGQGIDIKVLEPNSHLEIEL